MEIKVRQILPNKIQAGFEGGTQHFQWRRYHSGREAEAPHAGAGSMSQFQLMALRVHSKALGGQLVGYSPSISACAPEAIGQHTT